MSLIDQSYLNILELRLENYSILTSIFLTLPDEAFVENMLKMRIKQCSQSEGLQHIDEYIMRHQSDALQGILQKLSIDRTNLLRSFSRDNPRAPYERLYINQPPQDIIGRLNRFYAEANHKVSENLKEPPDQIGVEFFFMQVLCKKELEALEADALAEAETYRRLQHGFLKQHLGRWVGLFAQEMQLHAQTGFYRGIALLIQEMVQEELLAAVH